MLAELSRIVSSSLDLSEVHESFAEQLHTLIPFDRFSMSLVDHENQLLLPIWVNKVRKDEDPADQVPLAGSIAGEVVRTGSPIMLDAESPADLEIRFPALPAHVRAKLRSIMAVPLIYRNVVTGVLRVGSNKLGVYTPRHLELLGRIGAQIAGAVASS